MRPSGGVLILAAAAVFGGGPSTPVDPIASIVPLRPAALRAQAQAGAVDLTGVVSAVGGEAIAGATVELLIGDVVAQTTITGADGAFRFARVTPGVYAVRVTKDGLPATVMRVAVGDLAPPPLRVWMGSPAADRVLGERLATSGSAPMPQQEGVTGGVVGGVVGGIVGGLEAPPPAPATSQAAVGQATVGPGPSAPSRDVYGWRPEPFNREGYSPIDDNPFRRVGVEPVSTFSIDVDTASYANVRRFLNDGRLPPPGAVRVEEMINYFRFDYPDARGDAPIAVTTELAPCPWNPKHRLALVGLRAKAMGPSTPRRNLVFLLDVSGSMSSPDKLPLVRTATRMLADTLTAQDRVAIVVYAGASGLVLPSTPGDRKADIDQAIARLQAGGSTNGAAGIRLAYDTAAQAFMPGGVNRVILATDGDFNVGVTSQADLVRLIEEERARGIFLSVLGVGTGNLQDATMELLADRGNGNYSYLDSLHEARRVLIDEANATLITVAKDVKVQIEFNPRTVAGYRLVGYENRILDRQDFNDDRKDAGEMGAGHTVTALYEVIPAGGEVPGAAVDPLVYQDPSRASGGRGSGDLMTVKVRYKKPDAAASELMSVAVANRPSSSDANVAFAAAVVQFGMLLRDSEFKGRATWADVRRLARERRGDDPDGYRAEFVRLVDLAAALSAQREAAPTVGRR